MSVIYSLTREEMEKQCAVTMHATLKMLVEERFLSQETAEDILKNFTPIIIFKESLLAQLAEKLFDYKSSEKHDKAIVKVVRVCPLIK